MVLMGGSGTWLIEAYRYQHEAGRTRRSNAAKEARIPRQIRTSAMQLTRIIALTVILAIVAGQQASTQQPPMFDVIIRGGTVYDGTGAAGRRADVGIRGDRIAAVGDLAAAPATEVVDATGLAVAPGFINMLSWATESLLVDGRSQSDIRQGVTLEIFGEGSSMGPMNEAMKKRAYEEMGDIKYDITWTTLAEYLARARAARRLDQRRVVHRRDDDPRARDRPRRQQADAAAAGRDAKPGAPGDGGGRARHRLVADLCAGLLRRRPRS